MNSFYKKIHIGILIFIVIISFISSAPITQAQTGNMGGGYTPLEPLPNFTSSGINGLNNNPVQFSGYVSDAFKVAIAFAAFASVFMIVWGGLQYMSTDAWEGKSAGISKLKNAVFGLLLVLCSYLILETIDPRLVAIPATLVPPLKGLDYTPQINEFLGAINTQISSLRGQNTQLKSDIAAGQQRVTELNNQIQQITTAEGLSSDDVADCWMDKDTYPPCARILQLQDTLRETQGDMSLKTGMALMNESVMACQALAGNGPSSTVIPGTMSNNQFCGAQIMRYRDENVAQLRSLGQNTAADTLANYAVYSTAMQNINEVVTQNMAASPYKTAVQNTVQLGLIVAGVASGGVVGGMAVAAATELLINAGNANDNVAARTKTINEVDAIILRNLAITTDPVTIANLKTQGNNIRRSLGATSKY